MIGEEWEEDIRVMEGDVRDSRRRSSRALICWQAAFPDGEPHQGIQPPGRHETQGCGKEAKAGGHFNSTFPASLDSFPT